MSEDQDGANNQAIKGKLSRVQAQIVVFVWEYTEMQNGRPPSIREVLDAVDLKSTSGIEFQFAQLVKKGWLELGGNDGDSRRVQVPGAIYKNPPLPESVIRRAAERKPESKAARQLRERYDFIVE